MEEVLRSLFASEHHEKIDLPVYILHRLFRLNDN